MRLPSTLFLTVWLCVVTSAEELQVNPLGRASTNSYTSIKDALKAAKPGDTLVLFPGTHKEQVVINKDSITFRGLQDPSADLKPGTNDVSIEYGSHDKKEDDDSATLLLDASNFRAYNINITNTYSSSNTASPAISNLGDNNAFYTCGIHGKQGTFYAHKGSLFVSRSYIEGTVDVIYGRNGNAWFQGVKVGALRKGGTLTAQGREASGDDGWFVFEKGKLAIAKKADSGTKGSVYLGRPWGDYARTVFQNSNLGDVATEAGWQLYTSAQSTKNILFGEYSNTNADGPRVSWAKSMGNAEKITNVLPKYNEWVDAGFIGVSYPV
ncbi:hypothetical protein HYALB_00007134 [Hymenoscyphus albidus]|uniref:pectinesterase n=1 Tax=Hymenoscyphus albidus TaxID=595503 RepID=A0A9N9LIW9_9HELO|nr:hypothetical protein HYALB_00007134 [Hymenoscyphus albidus]